ncbi:unnamed protein product, partial [Ilex paraguariensis]
TTPAKSVSIDTMDSKSGRVFFETCSFALSSSTFLAWATLYRSTHKELQVSLSLGH